MSGDGARRGASLPQVAAAMAALLVAGLIAVAFLARPHRVPSVVLVVLDTVRADHLTPYGYARDTTPRLQQLAREAIVFEQARSAAPWTLPSHASLFTGKLPSQHGCTWEHRWLVDRNETIAERLALAGFETFGVTTNANASSLYHLDQGFDEFRETWRLRETHRGLDDSSIANAEIRDWLERRDRHRPFFLFVNYADAHLPYQPPPPYDRLFGEVPPHARELAEAPDLLQRVLAGEATIGDEEREGLAKLYDGELRAVDDKLRELLEMLEAHADLDQALVVVTSDHGEFLGEDGRVDHQLSLREELLRVPLLIRAPSLVKPARIREPVELTSVKGWIEDVTAGRVPEWTPPPDRTPEMFLAEYDRPVDLVEFLRARGRPFESIDRRLAAVFHPLTEGGLKLLVSDPGEPQLFSVDRAGRETLVSSPSRDVVDQLRELLQHAQASDPFVEEIADLEEGRRRDPAERDQLAKLGYVFASRAPIVGLHASEHWSAGIRARDRGDRNSSLLELERAARLAPDQPSLLQDLARAADSAGSPSARDALDRYLRSLHGAEESESAQWARKRLEELRPGSR